MATDSKSGGVENSAQPHHMSCSDHLSGDHGAADSTLDCFSPKSAGICFAFTLTGKAEAM